MQRLMISAAILVIIIYVGICTALFFYQRNLIYFQQPAGNTGAPTIALATEVGATLVSVRKTKSAKALLFFAGNADNAAGYAHYMATLSLSHPDHAIYVMHYRGYAGSSGAPTEAALFADAVALFDLVHKEHKDIQIIGRSLGSGIAVFVASQRAVAKLILVTPYDSIERVAANRFPWVPISLLLKDKYESWRYAPKITAPTLIIAAAADNVIPLKHSQALLGAFNPGVASIKVIANADHNSIASNAEYLDLLTKF